MVGLGGFEPPTLGLGKLMLYPSEPSRTRWHRMAHFLFLDREHFTSVYFTEIIQNANKISEIASFRRD
jgi:hypothetical protein